MSYEIRFAKQAFKDIKILIPKQRKKLQDILIEIIAKNPYEGKKLKGNLEGNYSLHLNLQDRIVYSIDEENKIVYIKRTRTHYES